MEEQTKGTEGTQGTTVEETEGKQQQEINIDELLGKITETIDSRTKVATEGVLKSFSKQYGVNLEELTGKVGEKQKETNSENVKETEEYKTLLSQNETLQNQLKQNIFDNTVFNVATSLGINKEQLQDIQKLIDTEKVYEKDKLSEEKVQEELNGIIERLGLKTNKQNIGFKKQQQTENTQQKVQVQKSWNKWNY